MSDFILRGAIRPDPNKATGPYEDLGTFTDYKEAVALGREYTRNAEDGVGEINYVEIRWNGKLFWCGWKRPEVTTPVAHLFD